MLKCDGPELFNNGMLVQVRMSEYNQLKGQVTAAARKQTGSLAVRDLTGLVSEDDAVNTENLLTLFTVVSKHDKGEWLSTYETLSDFVVRLPCLHIVLCITPPHHLNMDIALLLPLNLPVCNHPTWNHAVPMLICKGISVAQMW